METLVPTPIDPEQINKANPELGDRLFKEGVRVAYDEDGDTLFVTIGEPREGVAKPLVDGIYLQFELSSYKIIGCTILSFSTDFLAKNKLIRKMLPQLMDTLRASSGLIELKGQDAERTRPLFDGVLSH